MGGRPIPKKTSRVGQSDLTKDGLIGLRVQVVIEEDGTPNPPTLPLGNITMRLVGTDRVDYYLVHLDSPVHCIRATSGEEWTLLDLVISTRFAGDSLERLATEKGRLMPEPFPDGIVVGIANLFAPHPPDDPMIDFSEGEYFAIGRVKKA